MDGWIRAGAVLATAVGSTLFVWYLWRATSLRAEVMTTLLRRSPMALGRWLVPFVLVIWSAVPLTILSAIDPSRVTPRMDLADTAFGLLAIAGMLLTVTTATLAHPRWAILPSQRVEWVPMVEWLRAHLHRPPSGAKARAADADRRVDVTVAAMMDAAAQPWFTDAVPIIEATNARALREGRPPPYLTDRPDPYYDLTLDDLERHGIVTHEQVTAALARAGSSEVSPAWVAAYERGEGDGRGWSRRERLARIGLKAAWEAGRDG